MPEAETHCWSDIRESMKFYNRQCTRLSQSNAQLPEYKPL